MDGCPASADAGRTRCTDLCTKPSAGEPIERQAGWTGVPCTTARWNPWRAIDVLRPHPAAARRALVGELSRHGAAVAAAKATLARAVTTRDDLLAQILGWAEPAYTGDAMARHAGRSAEAVNALLEYPQALESQHHERWSRLPPRTANP